MQEPSRERLLEWLRTETSHYDCEDCWYSCAKLTCDERRASEECDCGADMENVIKKALLKLVEAARPEVGEKMPLYLRPGPEFMALVAKLQDTTPAHWTALEKKALLGFAALHTAHETLREPQHDEGKP